MRREMWTEAIESVSNVRLRKIPYLSRVDVFDHERVECLTMRE